MDIHVYNGEHFERTSLRYILFTLFLGGIIFLSVYYTNFIGAILVFFLVGAYILFSLNKSQKIILGIRESGLAIDSRLRQRQQIQGFVVEVDGRTNIRKTIIIIFEKNEFAIFSIIEEQDTVEIFVQALQNYIPLEETYPHNVLDDRARKIKL